MASLHSGLGSCLQAFAAVLFVLATASTSFASRPVEGSADETSGRPARAVAPPGGQTTPSNDSAQLGQDWLGKNWLGLTSRERVNETIRVVAAMSVLSLAPAILLMTTCYVRIIIVLSLLRQALGFQQLPSNQVTTTIALFLTFLVMAPVWKQVHEDAIVPYTDPQAPISLDEALQAGLRPVRQFMSQQIESAGNSDEVWLFLQYMPEGRPDPATYDDVPLQALLPAFLLSELKTAFLIGFQVYLPFVILDVVVASVTISMGMFMLPPTTLSLPLKLLLFVLVDGWHLLVGMLLESFAAVS